MIPSWLLVFLGGGLGAWLRHLVVKVMPYGNVQHGFPWSIFLINLTGSMILGFCLGISSPQSRSNAWWLFVATGILGGFTTFSTFSADNLILLQQQRYLHLFYNIIGSPALGLLCAWLGWLAAFRLRS